MRMAFSSFSPTLPGFVWPNLQGVLLKVGGAIALLALSLGLWMLSPQISLPWGTGTLPRSYYQALGLRQEGDLLGALSKLQTAAAKAPAAVPVLYELGRAEFQLAQVESAIAHYRSALVADPDHAPTAYELGSILVTLGNLDEGIALLQHSVELAPTPLTHYDLGIALGRSGDSAGAIANLQQVIALQPDYADAHLNLGIAYARLGQIDEAKGSLKRARDFYQAEIEQLEHAHLGRNSLDAQIIDQMIAALSPTCGSQCWQVR
jgi:tetratricopeptide (TPR) repeat protein